MLENQTFKTKLTWLELNGLFNSFTDNAQYCLLPSVLCHCSIVLFQKVSSIILCDIPSECHTAILAFCSPDSGILLLLKLITVERQREIQGHCWFYPTSDWLFSENCKSGRMLEGEKLNMHTKPRQSYYSAKLIRILLWNCLLGQKALRWLASWPAVTHKLVFNPLMEVSSIVELWHFAKPIGLN